MNLRKALKEKNKLAGHLNQLFQRMRENNITEDGQSRPYNSKEVLQEIHQVSIQSRGDRALLQLLRQRADHQLQGCTGYRVW